MPLRLEIGNVVGSELYSIEVYPRDFFDSFHPEDQFEKWAAVDVSSFDDLPGGIEILTARAGT